MATTPFFAILLEEARANLATTIPGVTANHPRRAATAALDAAAASLSQPDFWRQVDALGGLDTLKERLEAALLLIG